MVTLGKGGARGYQGGRYWHVQTPPIAAVSAVGSGDAFAAGLAAALEAGQSLEDATKLAAACGAANALTPLAGHLYRHDVDRLLAATVVQPA